MSNAQEKQEHANEDAWLCQLPSLVYANILNNLDNIPSLRASCSFFRNSIQVKKYSDINFKSQNPKTSNMKFAEYARNASFVYPLSDGRWVVIGEDTVIDILSCSDANDGELSQQLELHCEPSDYNYDAKFLVSELPNNVFLVMNHQTFYLWDISTPNEPEKRSLEGSYTFEMTASATCLVALSPEYLAFGFDNNKIIVMNMTDGLVVKELDTSGPVLELSLNFKNQLIAVCQSEVYNICSFDPKKDFQKVDLSTIEPKKIGVTIPLNRIIMRNNQLYSEQYKSDGDFETIFVSERENNYQVNLDATQLGNFKSFMRSDGTIIFWTTDYDTQDLKVQVKEYPRTAPEFSL